MINAELFTHGEAHYAKIGYGFYRWRASNKKWVVSLWPCEHLYERTRLHGKLLQVKIRMSRIRL